MKIIQKVVLASVLMLALQQGAIAAADVDRMTAPLQMNESADQPATLSTEDIALAFGKQTQHIQVAALSGTEMRQTEGAFYAFFVPLSYWTYWRSLIASPPVATPVAPAPVSFTPPTPSGTVRISSTVSSNSPPSGTIVPLTPVISTGPVSGRVTLSSTIGW